MTAAAIEAQGLEALRLALDATRRESLRPPPVLTVSQWADAHRYLSREASAEPGKWRTDRVPYLREIMDAFTDPEVEEVVIMSASQVGKTEILLNVIGYHADQDPAPILAIQPNVQPMAQDFSKDRLSPMIRDTPRLRGRFSDVKSRKSDNTILHKTFPGGHLTVAGANAPSGLASRPIRILLCDEVDRYPASAGTEGDPVALAKKRTATFWNRKIALTSTPTLKHISRIEKAYQDSSMGTFEVACPHCRAPQVLIWANLHYEQNDPLTAHMLCVECGGRFEEGDKHRLLTSGRWTHLHPERRSRGFHLNALYSPWARWADLVDEWLKAQGHPELLKTFVNTALAETWEEETDRADPDGLMKRRETYAREVPAFVGLLTAGVDVQADRLELLVRGWGLGEESGLIHYETLRGDPSRKEVWEEADRALGREFDGLKIAAACIDSGYLPEEVYGFVRGRPAGRRLFATKGNSTPGQPVVGRIAKRPNRAGVKIVPIGTESAKDLIYLRLKTTRPGPGYYHFPQWADAEYFAQLTSEHPRTHWKHGRPYRVYEKDPGRRNEALDLEVLAYAALLLIGPSTIKALGNLAARREPPKEVPQAPEPSPVQRVVQRIVHPPKPRGFATNF